MLLTVEVEITNEKNGKTAVGEVAICFDEEGKKLLLKKISEVPNAPDHVHLFTPAWGGRDLTEVKQGGDDFALANHLRLVKRQ